MQQKSFKALVNKYSPIVSNTATRILRDSQSAQDVHQEVFLEIWRRWHKFNGQTNWNAYIYKITIRKAIRLAKHQKTRTSLLEHQEHPASNNEPDENLKAVELHKKLAGCIAKLPKRQAQVFVLSRMEGLRAEKIAEMMDCSKETIRVHLHRALKKLAKELGDYLV
ncbi:MAG: sigma-70 family RNA polymerase sigma factor [Sedimentisphaerales bacterium]|nr:sigma-70 family RNA polymerase sigma factor [Sedimentisphaerales bacterium]